MVTWIGAWFQFIRIVTGDGCHVAADSGYVSIVDDDPSVTKQE
jgi:hypothetical protein